MLSFSCQKNLLSLSIILLLEVLYTEQPDDGFLNFFFVNQVCFQDYGVVGTSKFYVYTTKSSRGLCFKKEFQQLQLCGSCSYNDSASGIVSLLRSARFFCPKQLYTFLETLECLETFQICLQFFFLFVCLIFSDYNLQVRTK